VVSTSSCCSTPPDSADIFRQFADLLRRYDINDFAASVRVFAVKPS
jgi:arsenite methyltransferase